MGKLVTRIRGKGKRAPACRESFFKKSSGIGKQKYSEDSEIKKAVLASYRKPPPSSKIKDWRGTRFKGHEVLGFKSYRIDNVNDRILLYWWVKYENEIYDIQQPSHMSVRKCIKNRMIRHNLSKTKIEKSIADIESEYKNEIH
jgi:hypothetical protein